MTPRSLVGFLLVGWLLSTAFTVPAAAQPAPDSTYTVEAGDTLYGIAQEFGVSVRALQTWNDLEGTTIAPGQTLRVRPPNRGDTPTENDSAEDPAERTTDDEASGEDQVSGEDSADEPSRGTPSPNTGPEDGPEDTGQVPDSVAAATDATTNRAPDTTADARTAVDTTRVPATSPPPYGRYRTRAGDTFVSLALRTGTTADTLYALNDSLTAPMAGGSVLRLPRRFGPPTHVVQPGETLYAIAGEYGVSARALQAANDGLADDSLASGQRLRIPGRDGPSPAAPGQYAPADTTGPVTIYPTTFEGRLTASGEVYDPSTFVGSHPSLPYGSLVLLTAPGTGQSTFVRIVDRGPVEEAFLMDVSRAAADALGVDSGNTIELRLVWTTPPE